MAGREKGILLSISCLGMSSLITQIITLREFMNILAGNELILGIVLSNWLLLTGLGAYLGRFSRWLRQPVLWLIFAQLTIALLPLAHISLTRYLSSYFIPGLMPGLDQTILLSLALLTPYCLVSGFMLTLFSGLGGKKRDAGQIGKVYILDVSGDIIGGILFSFLLVHIYSSYQSLILLMVINLAAATLLGWMFYGRKMFAALALFLVFCLVSTLLVNLDKVTIDKMYPGQEVISNKSTPYGSLVVTRSENQITVYSNGIVVGSSENLMAAEESVHYGLSQHPDPKTILLISGGLNGNLQEAVKYPIDTIVYVELDPAVISLVKQYAHFTSDNRVTMVSEDARRFLKSKKNLYDVILIDLPDPSTAQLNRFYTLEFFQEVQKALTTDGIVSFRLSGAENYAQAEIGALSGTIYNSLISVFPNILIIPGANQYYIASTRQLSYKITDLLAEKKIQTHYVTDEYLSARLTQDRIEAAHEMIGSSPLLNTDFRPAGYFLLMKYWLSQFQESLLLPLILMGTISLVILFLIMENPAKSSQLAICSSGFTGLGLEIVLIIAFQVYFGYVYQQLGVIITGFLLGTALGSGWSVRYGKSPGTFLAGFDFLLALTAFGLALLLPAFPETLFSHLPTSVPPIFFAGMTSLIGFLVGAQFPLAAKLTFKKVEQTAGNLYALDYLGSALGGLIIAAIAIPVFGMITTCYLLGSIKLTTASILWLRNKNLLLVLSGSHSTQPSKAFPAIATVIFFTAMGCILYVDTAGMTLYSLSFQPFYHMLLLLLVVYGILQVMDLDFLELLSTFHQTRIRLLRWIYFLVFSLVVFFPVFRCYFKIPYLFCHVCPRQCVFGYLRPYLIPAALIMNLEKRHWCLKCCPLGTMFDCQARWSGTKHRLPKIPAIIIGIVIIIFTAYSYFRVKSDFLLGNAAAPDWYTILFTNQYKPISIVLIIATIILVLSFPLRRPFCDSMCPVGTLSGLLLRLEKRLTAPKAVQPDTRNRA